MRTNYICVLCDEKYRNSTRSFKTAELVSEKNNQFMASHSNIPSDHFQCLKTGRSPKDYVSNKLNDLQTCYCIRFLVLIMESEELLKYEKQI